MSKHYMLQHIFEIISKNFTKINYIIDNQLVIFININFIYRVKSVNLQELKNICRKNKSYW